MWGGTTSPPDGWLLCDGTLKSKTSYPELFAAIGVTYGGSVTSFNLPNFNDKFPKGSSLQNANTTGGQKEFAITKANLPPISHTHSIDHHHSIDHGHDSSETSEAGNHSHNFSIRKRSGTVDPNYTVFWAESNGSKSFTTGSNGEHKHRTYTPDHTGDSGGASNGNSGLSPATTPTAYKSTPIDNQPEFLQIQYIIKY